MLNYEGAVYRPPSEAYSLIIQATIGCSQNRCGFCDMYRDKKFRIRDLDEILSDLAWARENYRAVPRIFIADGDALIMPMEYWQAILNTVINLFPECERVTCYASPKSIALKTDEELKHLHASGLEMVYMGLESGNETVLKDIVNKGVTVAEIVGAAQRIKASGIKLSVTAINGLGGKKYWKEHAIDTGKAFSAMDPDYMALLVLRIYPGTQIYAEQEAGHFQALDAQELLTEMYLILENTSCTQSVFRSNHASNYLPLKGVLNKDKEALLSLIQGALEGQVQLRPDRYRQL